MSWVTTAATALTAALRKWDHPRRFYRRKSYYRSNTLPVGDHSCQILCMAFLKIFYHVFLAAGSVFQKTSLSGISFFPVKHRVALRAIQQSDIRLLQVS